MASWIPVALIALIAIAILRTIQQTHRMVNTLSQSLADPAALERLVEAAGVPEAKRAEFKAALRQALELGQKVEAIKIFRGYSGQGLRESKMAVDRVFGPQRSAAPGRPVPPLAPGPLEPDCGGDTRRIALALAVVIAGAAAYLAFG